MENLSQDCWLLTEILKQHYCNIPKYFCPTYHDHIFKPPNNETLFFYWKTALVY